MYKRTMAFQYKDASQAFFILFFIFIFICISSCLERIQKHYFSRGIIWYLNLHLTNYQGNINISAEVQILYYFCIFLICDVFFGLGQEVYYTYSDFNMLNKNKNADEQFGLIYIYIFFFRFLWEGGCLWILLLQQIFGFIYGFYYGVFRLRKLMLQKVCFIDMLFGVCLFLRFFIVGNYYLERRAIYPFKVWVEICVFKYIQILYICINIIYT
eukprot:TRINITY_DN65599_c0_g1_i7.p2 TRINITY_DN65599_c0_g1~~TRINITY_DN65599_c0_g1_i7.p2  ORF type:complete len:238 (-),score=-13.35 TRINITY_DN65599_c0_g1_i7:246-884(-)